jgi:hypothetical protein
MSIDEPLLTLDIIGADGDVYTGNSVLRQNKTDIIGRGPIDYILGLRNEVLSNRGYKVPENWDTKWNYQQGPIWSPNEIGTLLKTWCLPEYFKAESSESSEVCVEATNRVDGTVGFEQNTVSAMPLMTQDTASGRNYKRLEFDGANTKMRGKDTSMWNVGTEDFMLAVFVEADAANNTVEPIASKNTDSQFTLYTDYSGSNKDVIFSMNNVDLTSVGTAIGALAITCGRNGGIPFLTVNGARGTGTSDTTNLNTNAKPWLGDRVLNSSEFKGKIYEVIFIANDGISPDVVSQGLSTKLEGYLAWKYKREDQLASLHTYKNSPPRVRGFKDGAWNN